MHVYFYVKGIVFTRRVGQLLGLAVILFLAMLARRALDQVLGGLQALEMVFLATFILTYFREQRRAIHPPKSNVVINWNLFEATLFLGTIIGYFVFATVHRFSYDVFYAYFNTCGFGLLMGIASGEWLWQNTRLKQLQEEHREQYWINYKDNAWG